MLDSCLFVSWQAKVAQKLRRTLSECHQLTATAWNGSASARMSFRNVSPAVHHCYSISPVVNITLTTFTRFLDAKNALLVHSSSLRLGCLFRVLTLILKSTFYSWLSTCKCRVACASAVYLLSDHGKLLVAASTPKCLKGILSRQLGHLS